MDVIDCKTKDDIILYLVSNFNYATDKIYRDDFILIMGFRRAFCCHQVWYSKLQNMYAFHIEDQDEFNGNPNMGLYNSFYELLDGVADIYYKKWF